MNIRALEENYINYKIAKKVYNILKIDFVKLIKLKVIKGYSKDGKA